MPLFIAGLFRDRAQAGRVVTALLDAGVPSPDIALAFREGAEEDVSERNELAAAGHPFAELAVQAAWERLGWQGGARPAYRDTIPPDVEMAFVTAGPLAIAIGGAQVGAAAGGIVGAITNFGYPHELAGQWYAGLVEGRAWLMVRTSESEAVAPRRVYEKYRPELPAESLRHW